MQCVEIHIKGKIDPTWSDWFEGLEVQHMPEETVLSGILPDFTALYGVLANLSRLSIPLVSVYTKDIKDK